MENKLTQNQLEHLQDQFNRGVITADQVNVEKVKMARFQLVTKLPAQVRKALNKAVKSGELGHYKKDGHKPEVYFHIDFDNLARQAQNDHERHVRESISKVCI